MLPGFIKQCQEIVIKQNEPKIPLGRYCNKPYPCPFAGYCQKSLNLPTPNVLDLPYINIRGKGYDLVNDGVVSIHDPKLKDLTDNQRLMIEAYKTRSLVFNKNKVQYEMKELQFPVSYLDFETIGFALPRYGKSSPYQQIPFQFSVVVQKSPDSDGENYDYLHSDANDPREELAKALIKTIPKKGSVVAYNMAFERRILNELADSLPHLSDDLKKITDRLFDPLNALRGGVYDPGFHIPGSWSLKSVVSLVGETYSGMEIGNGRDAQRAFEQIIDSRTEMKTRQSLFNNLLEYCRKDTKNTQLITLWLLNRAFPRKYKSVS